MNIHNSYDIHGLVGAIQTREALEQAELHKARTLNDDDLKNSASSYHAPILDTNGKIFAGQFIKKHFALVIPEDVKEDTLIEYQGSDGKYYYGVVVKSSTQRGSSVTVKDLTPEEAVEHKKDHPEADVKTLTDDDLNNLGISQSKLASLLAFLDPSETFVMKIITFILMKNVFDQQSMTDIFISVYIRLVAFALLFIALAFLSTFFF